MITCLISRGLPSWTPLDWVFLVACFHFLDFGWPPFTGKLHHKPLTQSTSDKSISALVVVHNFVLSKQLT